MEEIRETAVIEPRQEVSHPNWVEAGPSTAALPRSKRPQSPLGLTREEFKALLSRKESNE